MTITLPVRRPGAAAELPPAGDTRSTAGLWAGRAAQIMGRTAPWLVRGVMGLAVLGLGPHTGRYQVVTILSGSMGATAPAGAVAFSTPLPTGAVRVGDVITYAVPVEDRRVVTHRVVEVVEPGDSPVVRTKGDANEAVDPWTASLQGDTAYEVRAVIPELGHLIQVLRAPVLTQALVYGAPALLAGWLLLTIWRPAQSEDQHHPACDTSEEPRT